MSQDQTTGEPEGVADKQVSVSVSDTAPTTPFVAGIGASAGGLDALERLFDRLPVDTGMAFVVVQHLSPDFKSLMNELLSRHTKMPIHRVEDGMLVEPNAVYLIPPKKNMELAGGRLRLMEQESSVALHLPIDIFFRSLAEDAGDRAVAVVLSGTGSDGSRGIRHVHEKGGLVVVQDLESAAFDGMPKNAMATGVIDIVAPPGEIAESILRYINHPMAQPRPADQNENDLENEGAMSTLFRLFRREFGIDFTFYRPNTIERRLERRIRLTQAKDLPSYLQSLMNDRDELDRLYRDLLVEVTHFFRDPQAFQRLADHIIPDLIRNAENEGQIRIWVPACATGEEAYSLAMLCHSAREELKSEVDIKVFATDVHRDSLETAGDGVYTFSSVGQMPEKHRNRYFIRSGELYHVSKELRQLVIFAPHDITKDPPFTRIDLVSCRNVLIYLESPVQRKVLSLFHFGLRPGGILFLGPSESVGDLSKEFDTVDAHWRIFRKLRDVRLIQGNNIGMSAPLSNQRIMPRPATYVASAGRVDRGWLIPETFHDLLAKYVPPSLLVNDDFELIHCFGESRRLLSQPEGRATLDVTRMVEGDLRMAISSALHRAKQTRETIQYRGVRVTLNGDDKFLRVVVEPYDKGNERMFLICLEELKPAAIPEPTDENRVDSFHTDDGSRERIDILERELSYTRESLQATVEELETSNEELQATNEELVASNEELQSTNEELHGVNEELYTVNAEHQRKINELTQLTDDMANLLSSTEIGTIFLDRELRIRNFTPAIAEAFHLLDQDIGRPIEHIASNLDHPDLMEDIRRVLRTELPLEQEVRSRNGKAFLERVQPYRTGTGSVMGVVLTFVNITAIQSAYDALRHVAQSLELSDRDLQEFAYAVSHDLQAPLRHIRRFCHQIGHQIPGNSEVQHYLGEVDKAIDREESMIKGLLSYSRVYSRGAPFAEFDCEIAVDTALANLQPEILASHAEIKRGELPRMLGDEAQITRVFQEIIENALKYCDQTHPVIEISVSEHGNSWRFAVSDNGIGIGQQHRDLVFIMFRRLGFKAEVPGDGVGLALCKRIVQRHRGVISVSMNEQGGSVFSFDIPKEQAAHPSNLGDPLTARITSERNN